MRRGSDIADMGIMTHEFTKDRAEILDLGERKGRLRCSFGELASCLSFFVVVFLCFC